MKPPARGAGGSGDDPIAALHAECRDVAGLVSRLGDEEWVLPTRCPGWSVGDVVLHLAQTDEMAVASLEGEIDRFFAERVGGGDSVARSVDDGAALMVDRERGQGRDAIVRRWSDGSRKLVEMLSVEDPHRRVTWVAGELSVRTLTTTRLAETWIHGGDVAEALGVDLIHDERLRHIARLAWRTLPYAFAREGKRLAGPVAFFLYGPDDNTWALVPDSDPVTVVKGDGVELCLVAARRLEPSRTSLQAEGPDAEDVLRLVRTYA